MMEKYGTDEAGVRQIMRERQQKSMQNPNKQKGGKAGWFNGNPELARAIGDKGRETQRRIREAKGLL